MRPFTPQGCLVNKIRSIQLEPVLFFLFPLCVISIQDRQKRHHNNTRTRNQDRDQTNWGKMKAALDICLIFLMLHTPGVLSLSTRKLHTDVHRCAKTWSRLEKEFWYGVDGFSLVHWDRFNPCVTQRSYCKQLCVTVSCSGMEDFFKDKTAAEMDHHNSTTQFRKVVNANLLYTTDIE